jgi:hypothetical protein
MEKASTIHLYTSTPPLTCDGRRERRRRRRRRRRRDIRRRIRNMRATRIMEGKRRQR